MIKYAASLKYTNNDALRAEVRPTHRAYLNELLERGKLHESGPYTDDSGALIVYNAESREEAESLLANDPFSKAGGVVESAAIQEWKIVFPASE